MDSNRHLSKRAFVQLVDAFFFDPLGSETLSVIRVMTGMMIAYIHFVWMLDFNAFFGPNALIDNATWKSIHPAPDYKWTYLAYTDSTMTLWIHELLAFGSGLLMALGVVTRIVCILGWFLTLMTVHRMTGFLFGLDQITLMLSMYLCLSRCGSAYSIDRWCIANRPGWKDARWFTWLSGVAIDSAGNRLVPCWSNRLSTRLIQLHLCVVYLFGGIGKMRGETWWDGSALWYSVASYEYQSMDMTWIGNFPFAASIATHITVFWEMSYCAVIWPRWTRPWTLGIACVVHGGIALFLGMITFGLMMIVANLVFLEPATIHGGVLAIRRRLFRQQAE